MYPVKGKSEKKRRKICDELQKYPYSFQMTDIGLVKSKAFESLRNDLTAKLGRKTGHSTTVQSALDRNLLAFVLFQLDDHEKALKETEEVLKMTDQQNNIVSLANKAYMLSMFNSFDKAQKVLDELKELQATPLFEYLLVKAKGELGASYLRFGPRFNKHAIDAFREILPQAKEPEVWIWKFCLAVAYRHALDLQHAPYVSHGKYTVTHEDTLKILQEIVRCKATGGEEAADANLKANAYAEMALLLRLTWDKTTEYQLCSQAETGPLACCKKALGLDHNDASVLWKSGKVYRNYKDVLKSRKLLEKAVLLQPSSAAYHHLGLTYKAMATNQRYGKLKTRRGGKREQRRKKAMASNIKRLKLDSCAVTAGNHNQPQHTRGSASQTQQIQIAERVKQLVKSPKKATQFDPEETNVQRAVEYLKKAVEFSAGENSRAAYDLALLHAASGNVDEALRTFNTIAQRQNPELCTPSGLLEQITSLEQMGLIYMQMANLESDERERKKLNKKSEGKLNEALALTSGLYSTTSLVKHMFGQIFQSPSALLKAAEAADCNEVEKRKAKASIFSLMNSHKQSLALLQDISEEARDAEYFKLKIQALVRSGQYGEAVATISCLKPTDQYEEVMGLLDEEDDMFSPFNIHLEAGREALQRGPCTAGQFTAALRHVIQPPNSQTDGSSCVPEDDSTRVQGAAAMGSESSEAAPEDLWDIMLLHDEEDDDIEEKAVRLGDVLEKACGLRVVRRDGNCLPGVRVRTAIHQNIENSRLVVVLPGKEDRLPEFEECVNIASRKRFVVLLTEGVGPESVPLELKVPRYPPLTCPADLLAPGTQAAGPYSPQLIGAVCRLFQSFANRQ